MQFDHNSFGEQMKINELTSTDIVNEIRSNPGCIQRISYPNEGEPQLDESAFCKKDNWNLHCHRCGTQDEKILCDSEECEADKLWAYSIPDDLPEGPESEIAEFLYCWLEDDKIMFETD